MSISIHTNLMAGNAARTLGSHYNRLSKSVQRLSSGLRINSAADDAAGLAIRELMRADVASLNQGIRNANDAISMIQTADGALAVIDEKLIRMKELAEQAATGTYNSTQRLIIDSEYQAMAAEIDRIANATDFNGIKLLDGSLSGTHNGKGLNSTGAMKIHFGTGNASAEDYYYVEIGDCTTAGLGLRKTRNVHTRKVDQPRVGKAGANFNVLGEANYDSLNTGISYDDLTATGRKLPTLSGKSPEYIDDSIKQQGALYSTTTTSGNINNSYMTIIPAGTKNFVFAQNGTDTPGGNGDNDIELFTRDGKHLAGTPLDDIVFRGGSYGVYPTTGIEQNKDRLGFGLNEYDASFLNSGPANCDQGKTLLLSTYNGMTIGYSGDFERVDSSPNDAIVDNGDWEILIIDEVTEDLILWLPGRAACSFRYGGDFSQAIKTDPNPSGPNPGTDPSDSEVPHGDIISIKTQTEAQQALEHIDDAIVAKDKVRAHLGALQNRLENTVTNLSVQAENMQASESRISDTDVATEMTAFVRNQILTESATAMLSQANSFPHMLMNLLG